MFSMSSSTVLSKSTNAFGHSQLSIRTYYNQFSQSLVFTTNKTYLLYDFLNYTKTVNDLLEGNFHNLQLPFVSNRNCI